MDWEKMEELFSHSNFKDIEDSDLLSNEDLSNRLRKTFYYSPLQNPGKDTMSFPITKVAVETFRKAAPSAFDKLGHRYASRVARDACISPCSLLLGIIYIKRLSQRNPDYLQNISSSDLFLISMMVASKYLYDEGTKDEVFNDEWAASGLVDTDHVNELEAKFLSNIDWKIFIKKPEFQQALSSVEARLAYDHLESEGWLSYTDALCILKSTLIFENIKHHLEFFTRAMVTCIVMYGGIVMACAGTAVVLRLFNMSARSFTPLHPHPQSHTILSNDSTPGYQDINAGSSHIYLDVMDPDNVLPLQEENISPFLVGSQVNRHPPSPPHHDLLYRQSHISYHHTIGTNSKTENTLHLLNTPYNHVNVTSQTDHFCCNCGKERSLLKDDTLIPASKDENHQQLGSALIRNRKRSVRNIRSRNDRDQAHSSSSVVLGKEKKTTRSRPHVYSLQEISQGKPSHAPMLLHHTTVF